LIEHKDLIDPQVLILNTAKGLYLKEKKLLSEAVIEALGRQQPYALLSGPSFAKEMMRDMPTAVVVASRSVHLHRFFSSSLSHLLPS
jgi:glycerol-3-phosphate dehydrogenase